MRKHWPRSSVQNKKYGLKIKVVYGITRKRLFYFDISGAFSVSAPSSCPTSHLPRRDLKIIPFFSNSLFIPSVIEMQRTKNGENGPAQNASIAVATIPAQLQPKIQCRIYPSHTGEYTTVITKISSAIVRPSLHSRHIHLRKFLTFSLVRLNIFLICVLIPRAPA